MGGGNGGGERSPSSPRRSPYSPNPGDSSAVEIHFERRFPDKSFYTDKMRVVNFRIAPFSEEEATPTEQGMSVRVG